MKNKLIQITDMTISKLLQEDVIMPSAYFKAFDKNAKDFEVEINDETFENEIDKVLVNEFNSISSYMNKAISNIDSLEKVTNQAELAMQNNDKNSLHKAQVEIKTLKKDMLNVQELIFQDSLTKAYNRKWIYKVLLNKEGEFKDKGMLVLLEITDFDEITSKYGNLISDNILIFVSKFLNTNLKQEDVKYSLVRYLSNKFMIFIKSNDINDLKYIISNIQVELLNTTLKSKNGIVFKTGFDFKIKEYIKYDKFQDKLEILLNGIQSTRK